MNYLSKLYEVLAQKKYAVALVFSFIAFGVLLSLTSGLFLLNIWQFNPLLDPLKAAMTFAIAILMALNAAVALHNYDMRKQINAGKASFAGAIAAFFTTGCAVCQPMWFFWLGLGAWTGFLADLGIYIGLFSISLLLMSLHYSLKSASGKCEVK